MAGSAWWRYLVGLACLSDASLSETARSDRATEWTGVAGEVVGT